tara:strand:- start:6679 stop:7935 length:1257 start_codon:yes stop_codon:yes gene_type:complete
MNREKVILAYSGGLDTSIILKWLANKGYNVICFIGNVGQNDDFDKIEKKAISTGATKVYIEDLRKKFVTDYIFPALQGNALYEGRYLLGTSLARPILAKKQIEIATKENAKYVSHGSTGKGNDQVRFELGYYALNPKIKVIAPWKDPEFLAEFKGRNDMIKYAKKYKIEITATKRRPYSEDGNIMHVSHEAGPLEDPSLRPNDNVFSFSKTVKNAPDKETLIEIEFQNGLPARLTNIDNGTKKTDPLEILIYLNHLGGENAIGQLDMVENRFIGIKSRGVYETPGATILWRAHRDLEGIAMDKEVMHLRDMLIPKFSELIYNGFWFSPEMDFIMAAFKKSQEAINGIVRLVLYKGNIIPIGRESETSLYDQDLSSMDIEGGFRSTDSEGFININAIRLKAHNIVLKKNKPYGWRKKKI